MFSLTNDQLDVSVLDPIQDRERLGSRYCVGGYVYAVADRRLGVVTSGPGYPDEEPPPVFDGQGLPEAFAFRLWPGADPRSPRALPDPGTLMLVIGVGLVKAVPPEDVRVMPVHEFAEWSIIHSSEKIRMETNQAIAGWAVELTRDLSLANRTLISETRLRNVGRDPLHVHWFPHPFYPNPRGECCRFNLAIECPKDSAYDLAPSGFVRMRPDRPWDRAGNFQAFPFDPSDRLVVLQRHPALGLVAATCSYVPSWLPVWGNPYTFSFEPYLDRDVPPGGETAWSMTYDF